MVAARPHSKGLEMEVAATNLPALNIREIYSGIGA
jgi:hypothetical protein